MDEHNLCIRLRVLSILSLFEIMEAVARSLCAQKYL